LLSCHAWAQAEQDTATVASDTSGVVLVLDAADTTKTSLDSIEVVDLHPQDSPENRGFLIKTGDGKSQLRFRGSIRVNGAYDLNGLQNQSTFSTYDIPVGDANITEPRFFMSAVQTRVGIEATRKTTIGDVFMRIEADFLNPQSGLRLRHAFGQAAEWLAGQTWSTFSDVTALPYTVDLDGPPSSVAERTVQIRYIKHVSKDFRWVAAVESPNPEISQPDSLQLEPSFQSFPDISGRIRKYGDWGHMQLSGILRSISVKDATGDYQVLAGIGGMLSGIMKLDQTNSILYQIVYGTAISRYLDSLVGKGLDVVYNPDKERFETLALGGGYISYGFQWNEFVSSYLNLGMINIFNKYFQPDDAFDISYYFSLSGFWKSPAGTRVGAEYLFGHKRTKDGQTGNANRLSFMIYYDF
jgi:hypothetical protein